jgi:hypothetical protein
MAYTATTIGGAFRCFFLIQKITAQRSRLEIRDVNGKYKDGIEIKQNQIV